MFSFLKKKESNLNTFISQDFQVEVEATAKSSAKKEDQSMQPYFDNVETEFPPLELLDPPSKINF